MKKAFYLKINRTEDFAIRNLSRWIDTAYLAKADCYIVCDRDELTERIRDSVLLSRDAQFIKSIKSDEATALTNEIATQNWANAAYAHLTTFLHAREMSYDYFWNIDADDTQICLSADRVQELLKCVETYAEKNAVDCFSLDMWRTQTRGRHWSFGITYTKNRDDWMAILSEHGGDVSYKALDSKENCNIDWYFTYLKSCTNLKLDTFYFENLKFIHYSHNFFEKPVGSGFYHWKEGKLLYPIMYYCFGIEELGLFDVAEDVVKFDIHIRDEEAKNVLSFYVRDVVELSADAFSDSVVNIELREQKQRVYRRGMEENTHVVCFGAGKCLARNYEKIKMYFDVKYVCDNNPQIWGKEVEPGMICISPEELGHMKNVFAMITVFSKNVANVIAQQMKDMGIQCDSVENWLNSIE